MKIAFLNPGLYEYASGAPEATGGTERDLWLLARALAGAGLSAVVGVRELLRPGEHSHIDGVEYVGIGRGQILLAWYKFLLSERPDWLLWESATHLLGPLVDIAKFMAVRTIFHAAFDSDVRPRHALSWRRHGWPLYAWGLFRTDRIFAQHYGQFYKLARRMRSKAYVLPKVCMLSGRMVDPVCVTRHVAREKYAAWVGMLRKPKRPDLVIEIARRMPHVRFVICGGPSSHRSPQGYSDQIIKTLRTIRNIEFRGQVSPKTAAQVIAGAALLLSTSDEEGFPNTFTQAWSAGTPVVSLKVDPDQMITKLGLGRVSHTLSRAIAEIDTLINSPQLREDIAARCRQYIMEYHSDTAVIKIFLDAIEGVPHSETVYKSLAGSSVFK